MAVLYDWRFWARDKQLAPTGDWRVWVVLAGRGFGKTRTLCEWVRWQVESGKSGRIALVAPTAADARDVLVEGQSGILAISPPWNKPKYEPSKRRLTWPNGAIATTFSADEPDRLRGPQHDAAACDELAAWRYPETFDMLMFGLRLGHDPRCIVTTTPRPVRHLIDLIKSPTTRLTTGTTFENESNLAPGFFDDIVRKYKDTRLGRQELYAVILDDLPGALWSHALIEDNRVQLAPDVLLTQMVRIVVAIDPAISAEEDSDETGIVVVGLTETGHAYIFADLSMRGTPNEWAEKAVAAYHKYSADRIIGEVNQGGDMVESTVRVVDSRVSYKRVYASKGKYTRAEPVAALYEQGKVHHVGMFPALEDQMCSWLPGRSSPDRVDALVWAITDLLLDAPGEVTPVNNPFYGESEAD
jgi:phage terminase large subunit-like protein